MSDNKKDADSLAKPTPTASNPITIYILRMYSIILDATSALQDNRLLCILGFSAIAARELRAEAKIKATDAFHAIDASSFDRDNKGRVGLPRASWTKAFKTVSWSALA